MFSKKTRFRVSKSQYYETITTGNTYLQNIASNAEIISDTDFKTEAPILYDNTLNLNSTYQDIIDCFGTLVHQVDKNTANQHSILFYKKKVGNHKVRLEIHVVNQKFLIGFITFNLTTQREKDPVIDSISEEYQINRVKNHLQDFRIYNDKINS
ncbi:MAG: hypothetical protein ACJAV5_001511 [Vicingaceae bacterium]|jgi:hypothetical protein